MPANLPGFDQAKYDAALAEMPEFLRRDPSTAKPIAEIFGDDRKIVMPKIDWEAIKAAKAEQHTTEESFKPTPATPKKGKRGKGDNNQLRTDVLAFYAEIDPEKNKHSEAVAAAQAKFKKTYANMDYYYRRVYCK